MFKVFVCWSLLFSSATYALDVQTFRPLNMSQGGFNLYDAQKFHKNRMNYGLYYNFVKHPLEFGNQNTTKLDDIVNDLHTANLLFSYEISNYVSLNIDLPYQHISDFENIDSELRQEEGSLGDLLVSLPIYLGHLGNQFRMKLIPKAIFNTGDDAPFVGESDVLLGLNLVLDKLYYRSHWIFNVGYQMRDKESLFNLEIGDFVNLGLGYNYDFGKPKGFVFMNELKAELPSGGVDQSDVNAPLEFFTGLRHISKKERIIWNFGYSKGLNNGYGAPDYRLFAGVNFVVGGVAEPEEPPKEEVIEEFEVEEAPAIVVEEKPKDPIIVYLEKITFVSGSDKIRETSYPSLNRLVGNLKARASIKRLEIAGHTDSKGSESSNVDLARRRALSVRTYLISKGIDAGRLSSSGYGPYQPIADNLTPQGRSKNRRVEFKVLKNEGEAIIFKQR